jgi:hypothetical protein
MGEAKIQADYLPDVDATRLVLGPFLTTAGHVLNDGAIIAVEVTTDRGGKVQTQGWLLDGIVTTTLLIGERDYPIDVSITSPLGRVTQTFASPTAGGGP